MIFCANCIGTGVVLICPDDCDGTCDCEFETCEECAGRGLVVAPDRRN